MSDADRPAPIGGIVPAAGMSRRMGRAKQSLPFRDSTITGTVITALLSSGVDAIVVVTRTNLKDTLNLPVDPRVTAAVNDDPTSEMIDSIRMGMAHVFRRHDWSKNDETCGGFLVIPGDMPAISVAAYRHAIDAFRRDPSRIVIAAHHGRRGHPIIFPCSLRGTVDELRGGLNELPRRFPNLVVTVDTKDGSVLQDIDDETDYEGQA